MTRRPWIPLIAALLLGCPSASSPPEEPVTASPLTGTLVLTVLDPSASPLAGALVTSWPLGFEAVSDEAGLARFVLLGGTYRLTIAAAEQQTTVLEAVVVTAGEETALEVELGGDQLLALPALRVTLQSAAGEPLAGALVRVGDDREATTDAEGIARFDGLPPGEQAVQILPGDGAGAAPWSAAVALQDAVVTQLSLRLSGAPSAAATWAGSEVCGGCHEDAQAQWAASHHAATWRDSAPPDLAPLLDAGVTVDVHLPTRLEPVQVTVLREGSAERVRLQGAGGEATWDVLGWYGSTTSIPLLDLPGGPAPGPVAWRSPGTGDLGEPAFAAGLVPYQPRRWFAANRHLRSDPATGGPSPATLEAPACLGCHALGFELQEDGGVVRSSSTGGEGAALERGVGCEACHGPGSEHVAAAGDADGGVDWIVSPGRLDPDAALDVCGACHSQGTATAELGLPVAFPYGDDGPWRPGRSLASSLDPAPTSWPDGGASGPNQQVDELRASPHGGSGLWALGCGECHNAHGPADGVPHELIAPSDDNTLCLACHEALSFGDEATAAAHTAHSGYDPGGPYSSGRCTGCHMPPTASRFERSAETGGGRLASHQVAIQRPATSLAAFGAAAQLPLDQVPPNACLTCHRWAELRYGAQGVDFHGPAGDPTLRRSYVPLTAAYELFFGGAP